MKKYLIIFLLLLCSCSKPKHVRVVGIIGGIPIFVYDNREEELEKKRLKIEELKKINKSIKYYPVNRDSNIIILEDETCN